MGGGSWQSKLRQHCVKSYIKIVVLSLPLVDEDSILLTADENCNSTAACCALLGL